MLGPYQFFGNDRIICTHVLRSLEKFKLKKAVVALLLPKKPNICSLYLTVAVGIVPRPGLGVLEIGREKLLSKTVGWEPVAVAGIK